MKKDQKEHIIFISIIVIVVIIIPGIIAYVFKNNKDTAFNKNKAIALFTLPAKEKIFVNGVIVPEKTENIYRDETKGSINKVSITDGQVVKKGSTLFTYKNDQITDEIDQANQQIATSDNQKKDLLDKHGQAKQQAAQIGVNSTSLAPITASISGYQQQIDAMQTQINTSKEQVKKLQDKEFTYITAPIDGTVTLNDSKDATKPYIVIESATFYVKGTISEKDQTKLKTNQDVDILIFAINKTISGKVKSVGKNPVAPNVTAGTQAATSAVSDISYYDANISLNSQDNLVNGFHVQATVKLKEEEMKIPKSLILEEAGKHYVFKSVNKKLVKQEITYINSTTSEVTVLSGLKESDSITKTTKDMKEGIAVE